MVKSKKTKEKFIPDYAQTSSRLELFVRIPYAILMTIVLYLLLNVITLWGLWAGLIVIVQSVYILITGKKSVFCFKQVRAWFEFTYFRLNVNYVYKKVMPYFMLLTDKRPGFNI